MGQESDAAVERMRKMKNRTMRWWTYFRRGHSTYLVFVMSFINFVVIQYRLVIETMPTLSFLFPRLTYFLIIFLLIYLPVSTIIGWLDYKRGAVPTEAELGTKANPWAKDVSKSLSLMCEGKNEEAKRILEKWIGE